MRKFFFFFFFYTRGCVEKGKREEKILEKRYDDQEVLSSASVDLIL